MSYLDRGPWIPRERELLRRGELLPTNCVPLQYASVCIPCEAIFDIRRIDCPNCGSEHFVPLEQWLFSAKETP